MAKQLKRFLDIDVLQAARDRLKMIFEMHDDWAVSFSGGKDSLVTLHLTLQVMDELGLTQKLNVCFRDEELIPETVIDFVTSYGNHPRVNLLYFAYPLESNKFILGKTYEYIQWDAARAWIRPKPEFAIVPREGDTRVYSQYDMDLEMARHLPSGGRGKVCFITGIRTDESIVRLRAVVNKRSLSFVSATAAKNINLAKPLYDWSQNDIFKFMYDNGIQYCPIYDYQMWNAQNLRVSTPLHAESSKRFDKLRSLYPVFYQQLIDLFPEMLVQERYYQQYDGVKVQLNYAHTWDGILHYIDDNLQEPMRTAAAVKVLAAKKRRDNNIARGENGPFGGYPLKHIFGLVLSGAFKREMLPVKTEGHEDEYHAFEQETGQTVDV